MTCARTYNVLYALKIQEKDSADEKSSQFYEIDAAPQWSQEFFDVWSKGHL
jgi:hypothetical protein